MRAATTAKIFAILLVLLAVALTAAWSTWQRRNLLQSSYDYATYITMETLSTASANPLLSYADPRFTEGWDADGVQRYIDLIAARLGPLEGLTITAGGIESLPLPFLNRPVQAAYSMTVYFPETTATAEIVLEVPRGSAENWQLLDFRVDSPLIND